METKGLDERFLEKFPAFKNRAFTTDTQDALLTFIHAEIAARDEFWKSQEK
jgi:hypothetical protein